MNTTPSIPTPTMALPARGGILLLGGLAATLAAFFVLAHWGAAIFAALVLVALAALESEPFLLLIVFLLPVGWFARINLPLGGDAARLDISTAARLLVVGGFFMGRLWRGEIHVRELCKPPLTRSSLFLLAAALASLVLGTSGITYGSLKAIVRLISYIGFYFFVLSWANSRRRIRVVVVTILASTILVAVFGIIQKIVGDFTPLWLFMNPPEDWFLPMEGRVPSFLNYSTTLAGYLNLILPLALAFCIQEKGGTLKKLSAWALGLGLLTLAFTQTRAAMVGFGCVIVLAIVYFCRDWTWRLILFLGLAALGAGSVFVANALNPDHLALNANGGQDIVTRMLLWATALRLFVGSPFFGVGYGNFVELYGSYISVPWIPVGTLGVHNTYLQFLAETGLVGFVAFALLVFRAVRQALHQMGSSIDAFDRALAFGTMGAIVTILVQGCVDFLFGVSSEFGTLFWILLALLVLSGHNRHGSSRVTNGKPFNARLVWT
jgi:putative inorganic carbon (HCO3(-)) transporter